MPINSNEDLQHYTELVATNWIAYEMNAYIELLGLPASGKTTLLNYLVDAATNENLKLSINVSKPPLTPKEQWTSFVRNVTSVTRLHIGKFNISRDIWYACQLFKQPTFALQTRMYLNCVRLESRVHQYYKNASPRHVIAFDQGLFQAIWSLALQADMQDQEMLSELTYPILNVMTPPRLVIFVDTPPDVAYGRLVREPLGHGRLVALLKENPAWMDRACMHMQWIWELTSCQPGMQTFRWDSDKGNASEIIDLIKRCTTANGELH